MFSNSKDELYPPLIKHIDLKLSQFELKTKLFHPNDPSGIVCVYPRSAVRAHQSHISSLDKSYPWELCQKHHKYRYRVDTC